MAPIVDKMKDNRLGCLGHVLRRKNQKGGWVCNRVICDGWV